MSPHGESLIGEMNLMDMCTQLVSVELDEQDADCVLVNLRVNLGMRSISGSPMLAMQNRMTGERMFSWLSKRVPRSVFEGFMDAARKEGFAE